MTKIAALLVDGSNMYASLKGLGFQADYKKMLKAFDLPIHKAYYFTAIAPATEQSTIRPMVDWMEYHGWSVIQKPTKDYETRDKFTCASCDTENVISGTKTKGNMDIEICTVAHEIASHCHTLYLATGDGDFRFMIEALQRKHGIRVVVVSTIKTSPPMCADSIRRQADEFIDLYDLRQKITRDKDDVADKRRSFLGR